MVLAHPAHAPFLIRKLWAEFIASPIPADALTSLSTAYVSSGFKLRPLLLTLRVSVVHRLPPLLLML